MGIIKWYSGSDIWGLVHLSWRGRRWAVLDLAIAALKKNHLPINSMVFVLHRKEIMQHRGPFTCLQDETKRLKFDKDLVALLTDGAHTGLLQLLSTKANMGQRPIKSLPPLSLLSPCSFGKVVRAASWPKQDGPRHHRSTGESQRSPDCSKRGIAEFTRMVLAILRHHHSKTLVFVRTRNSKQERDVGGLQLGDSVTICKWGCPLWPTGDWNALDRPSPRQLPKR